MHPRGVAQASYFQTPGHVPTVGGFPRQHEPEAIFPFRNASQEELHHPRTNPMGYRFSLH